MKIERLDLGNSTAICITGCDEGIEILTKTHYKNLIVQLDRAENELKKVENELKNAQKELEAKESIQRQLEDDLERTKGRLEESRMNVGMLAAVQLFAQIAGKEIREQKTLEYNKGIIRGAVLNMLNQAGRAEIKSAEEYVRNFEGTYEGGIENYFKILLAGLYPDKKITSESYNSRGSDTAPETLL